MTHHVTYHVTFPHVQVWTRQEEEGAHPFVMLLSRNGTASGLYVDSPRPMDITLQRGYKINVVILCDNFKIRYGYYQLNKP